MQPRSQDHCELALQLLLKGWRLVLSQDERRELCVAGPHITDIYTLQNTIWRTLREVRAANKTASQYISTWGSETGGRTEHVGPLTKYRTQGSNTRTHAHARAHTPSEKKESFIGSVRHKTIATNWAS
jgi:hypothetical protein